MLVFDIECVHGEEDFSSMDEAKQIAWESYSLKVWPEESVEEAYLQKAALFAEFGMICCISAYFTHNKGIKSLVAKTFEEERQLLIDFNVWVEETGERIAGHNIKSFDIPYVVTRMLIHKITPHKRLIMYGVKPWELTHILDTMTMHKQGLYRAPVMGNIAAACAAFGIPSPKSDIDGSKVSEAFWKGELDRIRKYCEADVEATTLLLWKFKNLYW